MPLNCAAIPKDLMESELFGHRKGAFTGALADRVGRFELAHGGTLFLDEIGEMPLSLQTRLLRVLEEKEVVRVGGTRPIPVDVRIISATHCDLEQRIRQGLFRADLFYRLGVLRMTLPPLRERSDDLVPLANWCLKNAMAAMGVRSHANLLAELHACAPLLQAYDWPGNVRELRNLMQRVALFLAVEPLQALTPAFMLKLAPELSHSSQVLPAMTAPPKEYDQPAQSLAKVLADFDGNRAAAAAHLGISRTTLWRRLRQSD